MRAREREKTASKDLEGEVSGKDLAYSVQCGHWEFSKFFRRF